MKRLIVLVLLVCGSIFNVSAQLPTTILDYIQHNSDIKEGGCNVFSYNDSSYIICVSQVVVGNKNESTCRTVGAAKSKRDILSFVNGSDITSSMELRIEETVNEFSSGTSIQLKQEYVEIIKENVVGSINQCTPLGGWYSSDGSVYYYAIYKILNL